MEDRTGITEALRKDWKISDLEMKLKSARKEIRRLEAKVRELKAVVKEESENYAKGYNEGHADGYDKGWRMAVYYRDGEEEDDEL